jgi:hypothetical protein
MDSYPLVGDRPNIVYTVYWTCTGSDSDTGITANQTGYCNIPYDPSTYVPYEELLQDTVLGWVWTYGSIREVIEDIVSNKLSAEKNPLVSTPLPW